MKLLKNGELIPVLIIIMVCISLIGFLQFRKPEKTIPLNVDQLMIIYENAYLMGEKSALNEIAKGYSRHYTWHSDSIEFRLRWIDFENK